MNSIKDIQSVHSIKNRSYWNCKRPFEEEIMYFLLIDRFHDGKVRACVSRSVGFGNAQELQARFGGTIQGVISQLTYISEMGFTSIWLNPFQQNNPESYHGYSIENFLEVDEQWGSKADLIELVKRAHALNMRIFFDIVLNHTGDNWSYVKKNPSYKKGAQFAVKSWRYENLPIPSELRNLNCYNRKGRIVDWESKPETWEGDIYELKDLVQDESIIGDQNLAVMIAIYSYWFTLTDCDGFRIDAAKHIPPTWLNKFITEIKKVTLNQKKENFLIFAEIISSQEIIDSYKSIDGYLDFDFFFTSIKSLLNKNSKTIRIDNRKNNFIPIRFLDNHDQIGQRPKQRIANQVNKATLLNLLRVFLLMPGVPCVYYGTEQGMKGKGYNDGAIRASMFDSVACLDMLNPHSVFYKTIKEFICFRKEWNMYSGIVESCIIQSSVKESCIALQVSDLTHSKLILYNLKTVNECVTVKLIRPMSRTNKLVVYLYTDTRSIMGDLKIETDIIYQIPISGNGFIVLDIGVVA